MLKSVLVLLLAFYASLSFAADAPAPSGPLRSAGDTRICEAVIGRIAEYRSAMNSGLLYDPEMAYNPLAIIRKKQKLKTPGILLGDESSEDLLASFAAIENQFLTKRNFSMDNVPSQLMRFFGFNRYKEFKKANPGASATQGFGIDAVRAWKDADDYLASIPVGQLKLSIELFRKVAALSGRVINVVDIPGYTADNEGTLKKMPNIGRAPMREPISDKAVESLKANKWIEGWYELPSRWSKPGARRGIFIYAWPSKVEQKFAELIKFYEDNKGSMDPIRLATEFQRAFISIHPFINGNGRVSRLLMDRILLEFGLPPPLILDNDMDLYAPLAEYEAAIRSGVADTLNLLKDEIYQLEASSRLQIQMTSSDTMVQETTKKASPEQQLLSEKFAKLSAYNFRVGDRIFSFAADGFIYDQFAIPYEYYQGTLYPVADRVVEFYDYGGEVRSNRQRFDSYVWNYKRGMPSTYRIVSETRTVQSRRFSVLKIALFQTHLHLLEKIMSKQMNAEIIKVVSSDKVKDANEKGRAQLYSWQAANFMKMLVVKPGAPAELALAPSFVSETQYSDTLKAGIKPSASLILAQYEAMDLNLSELANGVKEHRQLYDAIFAYRRYIHSAAKELLAPALDLLNRVGGADKTTLEADYRYKLFMAYLGISKLNYATFDEAIKAGADEYVPLIRSGNKNGSLIGYIPPRVAIDFIQKIPFMRRGIEWINTKRKAYLETPEGKKKIQDFIAKYAGLTEAKKKERADLFFSRSDIMNQVISGVLTALLQEPGSKVPYTIAGERRVWFFMNRAGGGDNSEVGLSSSTNPSLYYNGAVFATGTDMDTEVNVFKAPRNAVALNYVSGFSSEYEVIIVKPVLRNHIVIKFRGDKARAVTTGACSTQLTEIFKKVFGTDSDAMGGGEEGGGCHDGMQGAVG